VAEVPCAAETPHLLSLDPPLTNRLACADIPLQLFNTTDSLCRNYRDTARPHPYHPHHPYTAAMALKRINKELTDLGRCVA
jgi:hypothetical protein